MSKGKLQKFAEMETFNNVFQYPYSTIKDVDFELKGQWNTVFFKNNNPIILELGCGKGEYTVELAKMFPSKNFIGVDIKGSRMHSGAKQAIDEGLTNVAFLRTNIEIINAFFAVDEVAEIWLTFSDPQMKKSRKRLTNTLFLDKYRQFLVDNGIIHLKTDSNFLYTYTLLTVHKNNLNILFNTDNLYHEVNLDDKTKEILSIKTYYEQQWIDRGIDIKYLKFNLPHNIALEEINEEIPLDEYRSYNRNKRSSLSKTI